MWVSSETSSKVWAAMIYVFSSVCMRWPSLLDWAAGFISSREDFSLSYPAILLLVISLPFWWSLQQDALFLFRCGSGLSRLFCYGFWICPHSMFSELPRLILPEQIWNLFWRNYWQRRVHPLPSTQTLLLFYKTSLELKSQPSLFCVLMNSLC